MTSAVPARLQDFRNWNGHWYAESHLEEWLARFPTALFSEQSIRAVGSQNYVHLPEKIDLLLIDEQPHLHIVEIKVERVARNRGIAPDRIQAQMTRYVEFLESAVLMSQQSFMRHYSQFAAQFFSSSAPFDPMIYKLWPLPVRQIFLTEGYDDYAIQYFSNRYHEDAPVRLIYYRFYVHPDRERHFIEFWETPLVPRINSSDFTRCKRAFNQLAASHTAG